MYQQCAVSHKVALVIEGGYLRSVWAPALVDQDGGEISDASGASDMELFMALHKRDTQLAQMCGVAFPIQKGLGFLQHLGDLRNDAYDKAMENLWREAQPVAAGDAEAGRATKRFRTSMQDRVRKVLTIQVEGFTFDDKVTPGMSIDVLSTPRRNEFVSVKFADSVLDFVVAAVQADVKHEVWVGRARAQQQAELEGMTFARKEIGWRLKGKSLRASYFDPDGIPRHKTRTIRKSDVPGAFLENVRAAEAWLIKFLDGDLDVPLRDPTDCEDEVGEEAADGGGEEAEAVGGA